MKNQKLFEYMSREHNVLLLESEMSEIIDIVKEIIFEAQVETPSVSDNEGEKKLCQFYGNCEYKSNTVIKYCNSIFYCKHSL